MKAKKRFGQNFLKDDAIIEKIIEAMPNNKNHIVEIGPGLGDLTSKLVKIKDVTAYEIDVDMYDILRDKFHTFIRNSRLNVVLADVLDIWDKDFTLHSSKYDLIANLPYYVATNIILRSFDDTNCQNIIVMVQKEVAKKFSARVGDKEYSSLSVIAQLCSKDIKIIVDVPPTAFEPMPKVDSQVIFFSKNSNILNNEFKNFLKVAFLSPRKKLFNNLSTKFDKTHIKSAFDKLSLKENIRPHEVDASCYHLIYKILMSNT